MKNQFKNLSLSPYIRETKVLENSKENSKEQTIQVEKLQSRRVIPNNFYKPITKIINFNEFE
ncbi:MULTISPECIES: hypothetical protein [unclassified Chryseobacterium]|uniref:hypothetical protein n=1 Tax=unclassified Chryseobacterium TaxID=2593645 RepID=UPI0021E6272B|nr:MULTISPECIES: hypothetical protein [unclassified Chryseobacterium]MEA1850080.1 hypothetical protein [Chryseobacterium sp. MHB01]